MSTPKNIFITGTNRGLGKDLVKLLIANHPEAEIHISARLNPKEFQQEWTKQIGKHKLHTYQIDLSNLNSIIEAKQLIKSKNIQFDTIVANAAVGADFGTQIPSVETAEQTLHVNVRDTINFIKQFIPLLSPTGRIVIVSSTMADLDVQSQTVRKLLSNPKITEAQILQVVEKYIESAKKKQMGYFHWSAYRTSKALITAWTRFVLPNYLKEGQTFVALCPGWCQTDMGGNQAPLSSQQGASRINEAIWLKNIQKDKFYKNHGFTDYQKLSD